MLCFFLLQILLHYQQCDTLALFPTGANDEVVSSFVMMKTYDVMNKLKVDVTSSSVADKTSLINVSPSITAMLKTYDTMYDLL